MNLDTYPVESSDDLLTHSFMSEGPRGIIMKRVELQKIGCHRYNLAFGDDRENHGLDDTIRSNNRDREKVLATVATIVDTFLQANPHARIDVGGSTAGRTRLYQMKIFQYLQKINVGYIINGSTGGRWEPFEKERNYDAFFITTKSNQDEKK